MFILFNFVSSKSEADCGAVGYKELCTKRTLAAVTQYD